LVRKIVEFCLDYLNFLSVRITEVKMSEMFELLKEGLNDIIEYQHGKKKLRKRTIDIPEPTTSYSAQDVKRIRESLNCPQNLFEREKFRGLMKENEID
jgi:hypothetical protein